MPQRVGQSFLHEPVRGQVQSGGERLGVAGDRHLDRQPGTAELLDQPGQLVHPRCGLPGVHLAVLAQHTDHPAHLGQGLTAGGLHGLQASRSTTWSSRSLRRTAEVCTVMMLTL